MQYVYNSFFTQSTTALQPACSRSVSTKQPIDALSVHADKRYQLVDEILTATSYYTVLGVTKHTSTEDIRRAYIKVTCGAVNKISMCVYVCHDYWHFLVS